MITVVIGVLERDGKLLIGQRKMAGDQAQGKWEFPGGKVEKGESRRSALHREWEEELGITEMVTGECLYEHTFLHEPALGPFVAATYVVTTDQEPRCLNHQQIRWVTLAELYNLDCAPSLAKALTEGLHGPACG